MGEAGVSGGAPDAAGPPAGVGLIASETEARDLACRLLVPGRRWPVVVLTIASGHEEPFGRPEQIKQALGDLAEVILMPTSEISWAFSDVMPVRTQVYGGAGRVYPVDHDWVNTPARSRLRFAYSPQDGERISEQLIHDALEAALAAGLVELRTRPDMRRRSGRVRGIIGSRAVVDVDDGPQATVWEELTVPGVPLARLLTKGQSVVGAYDPASRRLDLRAALRYQDPVSARAAVARAYQVDEVVLADVTAVLDDVVTVRLLPGLPIEVHRDMVTCNPKDTLRGLFTIGEVVACRIIGFEPLRLRMNDIDDEEMPRPAPSLLLGGPPWLCLPEPDPLSTDAAATEPALVLNRPVVPITADPSVVPEQLSRRPTPLDLARRSAAPAPRPVAPAPAAAPRPVAPAPAAAPRPAVPAAPPPLPAGELMETVGHTRIMHLSNELAAERATRKGLAAELVGLRARAAELEAQLAEATRSVERLRGRYRNADQARQQAIKRLKAVQNRADHPSGEDPPVFLDPEDQFRHEVYCEWVRRIPAPDKASKPLADYDLAPGFLDSIEQVEGISRAKVVAVVVEVLTGQDARLDSRDLHQLRAGGPSSPAFTRTDGATCWRAALQRESAAARRLHYWRLRDRYEFSRVVLHDDYRP